MILIDINGHFGVKSNLGNGKVKEPKHMKLEIIATSLVDAIVAEQAGADRLELCSALTEGGLTPSLGLIEAVVSGVTVPVHVIIRPHSRTFTYDEEDIAVMLADIRYTLQAGAAGIVIGVLDDANKIDTSTLTRFLKEVGDMNVTFHRAFDEINDQIEALEILAGYPQIQRVLTSGGQAPAPQSIEKIKKLVDNSRHTKIKILAGNGLVPEGIAAFVARTGVTEVHFGSAIRQNRSFNYPISPAVISEVKRELNSL